MSNLIQDPANWIVDSTSVQFVTNTDSYWSVDLSDSTAMSTDMYTAQPATSADTISFTYEITSSSLDVAAFTITRDDGSVVWDYSTDQQPSAAVTIICEEGVVYHIQISTNSNLTMSITPITTMTSVIYLPYCVSSELDRYGREQLHIAL